MKKIIRKLWFRKLIYLFLFFIFHSLILWVADTLFNFLTNDFFYYGRLEKWGKIYIYTSYANWIFLAMIYLIPFWIIYTSAMRDYIRKNNGKLYRMSIANVIVFLTITWLFTPILRGAFTFGYSDSSFGFVVVMASVLTVPYIMKALSFHKYLTEYIDKADEIQVNTNM